MRVAILGAGAIGLGMAALLCEAGHEAVLWSPSGRSTTGLGDGPLIATGVLEGSFTPAVASTCAEALAGAGAIIVAAPGNAHRFLIDAAVPHLGTGQTVIFSSHMSFAAIYLRAAGERRGVHPTIVAWGTTVITARRTALANEVAIGNIRSQVDLAVLPASESAAGLALCGALFGDRFRDRGSLLAIALSNLNPQNHLAIALCNLTRMERGESWKQYANTTHAVGRLMEALDAERMAAAAACGVAVRSLHEHFRLSFAAEGATMGDMADHLAQAGRDPDGPATLDSRYVLEDVPFGLWPSVRLAQAAGVAMPLHAGGVAIFSALYGRDFPAENDILPAIGDLGPLLHQG